MVALFTVVVEANCIRQPVSLLFPHSGKETRKLTGETGCFIQLASDTNISYATKITTLWYKKKKQSLFSVTLF